MSLDLTADEITGLFPGVEVEGTELEGGQKLVFPVSYEGSRLALKFVDVGFIAGDPDSQEAATTTLERAQREVNTLARLSSPHLVRRGAIEPALKPVPRHRSRYMFCYSEEWVDGKSLRQVLREAGRQHTLDLDKVVKLGLDILEALEELEQIKIVHRDVKPENIILRDASCDFVLIDLGICYDLSSSSLTATLVSSPVTVGYASPEQLYHDANRNVRLDSRSDLFCLGVVLYEALCGLNPFYTRGNSSEQWVHRVLHETPIRPSGVLDGNTTISGELDAFVMKLLAKPRYLRFRTCTEARQALRQTGGKQGNE